MAEMTVLVAAVYRNYRTLLAPGMEKATPGVTSRFEVFHDVTLEEVKVSSTLRTIGNKQITDVITRNMNVGSNSIPGRSQSGAESWH
jgi:hypothetical protein